MTSVSTRRWWGAAVVLAAATAGCESGPKLYPVRGKLTYEDGKPVGGARSVMFQSADDPACVASGDLEPDGSFELYHISGKPGTVAGTHKVMILTERPEWGEKRSGPLANYQSFDTSGLTATVEPRSDNYCEVKLKREKR
ncbi:MAG TPA: hypothetical protein VKE74_07295 [Gemmataceae bacterium]|nr:hypothetical protein [Gemmataceae bacterium]